MTDRISKRYLIDIDAEADKARRELAGLGKSMKGAQSSAGGLRDALSSINWKAVAIGVGAVTLAFRKLVQAGVDWSGTMRGVEHEVERLRDAVDGMIGNTALARLAEWRRELNLSQTEVDAIAKAGVQLGRINKTTFDQGLQSATTAVVGFEQEALKKLGIQIDLVGTKAQKQQQVIDALVEKYGDLEIQTENAGEEHAKLSNRMDDTMGRVGAAIVESESYRKATSWLASTLRDAAIGAGILDTRLTRLVKTMESGLPVVNNYTKALGEFRSSNEDMLGMLGMLDGQEARLEAKRKERHLQDLARRQKAYDAARRGAAARAAAARRAQGAELEALYRAEKAAERLERRRASREKRARRERFRSMEIVARQEARDAERRYEAFKESEQRRLAFQRNIFDQLGQSIASNTAAVIAGEKSAGEALREVTVGELRTLAVKWGAIALALWGRYAASWGTDAGALTGALSYSAAAVAAGAGAGIAGAVMGGGAGSGAGGAAGASGGSGFSTPQATTSAGSGMMSTDDSGGPANITHVHVYGRGGLLPSRKQAAAAAKRWKRRGY